MRPGETPNPIDIIGYLPAVAGAGSFIVTDPRGTRTDAFVMTSATGFYRVDFATKAIQQLPNPPAGLTFGAGVCAVYDPSGGGVGPTILVFGPGTGGGVDSYTAMYIIANGAWGALDAFNTMDALLGATWATDGAMAHPCTLIGAAASDDLVYLTGNGALPVYQYSWGGDTWTTTPPAARNVAAGAGTTFVWPWGYSFDVLYSLDGGGVATGEAYTIAGDAWGATAFGPPMTTILPNTGTCACTSTDGQSIYIRANATGTIYRHTLVGGYPNLTTIGQLYGTDGAAVVGNKMCAYEVGGVEYLVCLMHGSTQIQRIRIVK